MLDKFNNWFAQRGGRASAALGLHDFGADGGRGAVALADVAEDKELAFIPRSLVLTTRTAALPTLLGEADWAKLSEGAGWTGLIACMCYEVARGSASEWAPYLDALPTSFDSLMFWSEDELAELKGSAILGASRFLSAAQCTDKIGRADAEQLYRDRLLPIVQSRPDVFGDAARYTLDLFHRMGSLVLSRSFHAGAVDDDAASSDSDEEDPSTVGMVPWADFLNARSGCNNARLFTESDGFRLVATKPIARGEQIWNTCALSHPTRLNCQTPTRQTPTCCDGTVTSTSLMSTTSSRSAARRSSRPPPRSTRPSQRRARSASSSPSSTSTSVSASSNRADRTARSS